MSHAYYICGGCGQRLSFGRPLYEHRCEPLCLICSRPVASELSVRVNEGWMHDACRSWDAAGRPKQ